MKKEFQRSSQEKGITLVALVITIVILIILAVVAINAVFGDGGLLQYAQDARNYQTNADSADSELINSATEYIDGIIGGGSTDEPEEPTTPSTVEDAKNSGDTFDDTTTIKDDLDNDVTIPGGFHIAEDSGTKIEEGIVIEDEIGNQFVWIPVGEYNVTTSINAAGKLTNNLSRRTFTEAGATEVNGDDAINTDFYGEGNENSVAKEQIEGFKTSATTNGGFYIGRYEAGTEVERTSSSDELTMPLVQANKNVYVYVTRDQAKTQAEAMYSENSYVTSELISSYAWDTTLNFICQTNEEGYLLSTTTDNTYGNIGTRTKELTGTYEADNYSNIHDILGNCYEWTTEYSSNSNGSCVGRGGSHDYSANFAANRGYDSTPGSNSYNSFRLQLYIK